MNRKTRRRLRNYRVFKPGLLDFLPDECIPQKRLNSLFLEAVTYNQLPEASFYLKALLEGFVMHYLRSSITRYAANKIIDDRFQGSPEIEKTTFKRELETKLNLQSGGTISDYTYWNNKNKKFERTIAIAGHEISKLIPSQLTTQGAQSLNISLTSSATLFLTQSKKLPLNDTIQGLKKNRFIAYALVSKGAFRKDQAGKIEFWARSGKLQEATLLSTGGAHNIPSIIALAEQTGEIKAIPTKINLDLIMESLNFYLNDANNEFKHCSFSAIPSSLNYAKQRSSSSGLAGLYSFHVVPLLQHLHDTCKHRNQR